MKPKRPWHPPVKCPNCRESIAFEDYQISDNCAVYCDMDCLTAFHELHKGLTKDQLIQKIHDQRVCDETL